MRPDLAPFINAFNTWRSSPRDASAREREAAAVTPQRLIETYLKQNYRVVFWPAVGDAKGPKERGWPEKHYTIDDYQEGCRVGILTGVEVAPGKFLHDVDIDWAPGSLIAQQILPSTGFVFGRASKRVSHCFYTTGEAITSYRYEDIDKTCLIELRGTKLDGSVGLQTMTPPSVWSKGAAKEPLAFVHEGAPSHVDGLRQRVCLAAIGMMLAKHLGKNGFGHEPRLAWAGFLLRAGLPVEDVIVMGEAMSGYCNNLEVHDVRRSVESTASALASSAAKKVVGGPALAKLLGTSGKVIIARINEWLGRDSDFIRNSDGIIVKDHQDNVRRALELIGLELSHDSFAERSIARERGNEPTPLDDGVMDSSWLRIDRECRFRPTYTFYEKVVKELAREASFHPVRDYLKGLTWDREPRIDRWLSTYGDAEDQQDSSEHRTYLEAVSAIVLIAAVRRIMHPGCKYDEMLVLESEQGMNKSSALRALCPRDEWFSDDLPLNVDAKQIIERTLGKWIIEASDLVGGRKADRDHLKSMLSRQVDGPARLAYAHLPIERPRQFIIVGTTNSASYLEDMTGARRFWPVKVKRFNLNAIIRDRDQLWAEAAHREATGESIRLPEELYGEAGTHQEQRREVDAWEEVLEDCVNHIHPSTSGRQQVATDTLWNALNIPPERRDRGGARRISEIMQRFGFERGHVRIDDKVQVGYMRDLSDNVVNFPRGEKKAKHGPDDM